jgi:hypothetical protein
MSAPGRVTGFLGPNGAGKPNIENDSSFALFAMARVADHPESRTPMVAAAKPRGPAGGQGVVRRVRMAAAPESVRQSVRVRSRGWMMRSASMSACQRWPAC